MKQGQETENETGEVLPALRPLLASGFSGECGRRGGWQELSLRVGRRWLRHWRHDDSQADADL